MNRKLFSFDLDGTLLNSEGKLLKQNKDALILAKDKGHILVAATGRNYIYSQIPLKESWDLFDYFVGCNGAIVHEIKERKIISDFSKIPFQFVLDILYEIKEVGGTIQVSTEWNVFTDIYIDNYESVIKSITKERLFDPFPSIFDMDEKEKDSIIQISIHLEEFNVRKYWNKWVSEFGDKYEFTITSKNNIDINVRNISKLNSIKEISLKENIPYSNVFVFGDSQNDMKALEYFNNSYAMKNALDEVKKIAKNIIGDNDSNDIAKIVLKNI